MDSYAVSLHACHVTGLQVDDRIAVIGAGPIGLTLLEMAKVAGAEVLVTDVLDYPLQVAKKLGADAVVNTDKEDGYKAVMEFSRNRGVDIAFECAGGKAIEETLPKAISYARIGGKVCLVGGFDSETPALKLDWEHIQKAEIQLIPSASYSYWGIYSEMKTSLGKLDARSLITHRFSLDKINEAFNVASDKVKNKSIFVAILNQP